MSSANILTLIVVLIILFYAFGGVRKGFIKTLLSMAFFIMAAVLVYFANPYVSSFLKEHTPIYWAVEEKCQEIFTVENLLGENFSSQEAAAEPDRIEQTKIIESLPLPDILKEQLTENNNDAGYVRLAVSNFEEYIAGFMANLILTVLSYVVTFLLAILALKLLMLTLDVITELPVLKSVNQILGFLVGGIQGVCVVWVLFLVITILGSTDMGSKLLVMIGESSLLSFFYDTNIFLKVLMGIIGGL